MAFKPVEAPHFFKIIQPQIVRDGRLAVGHKVVFLDNLNKGYQRIPKKFVAKYGKDLLDRVYLKVPCGLKWLVNLSISNGEVWLQEGWKEFAEHYSIGLWHFLVFRYEGNSHFHVLIFDKSASEIEYPSSKSIHEERTDLNGESQLKRKGVIDENNVKTKKTRSNLTYKEQIFEERPVVTQMEESAKNASNCNQASRMKNVKSEEELHSFDFVKEVGDGGSGSMPNTHKISCLNFPKEHKGMASEAEKERALQSAKAFTSEYPFFMATIQPSYLKYNLTLPVSFTNRYFKTKDKPSVNFTLGIKDGRTWQVNFATRTCKLSKGWTTFASDNCLEVGDVCIFELIKGNTNFLNVVVFQARKDTNC